jgi:glutathione synthase
MTLKLGVVMDPISAIHYKKDTTLAMLWEAEARGYQLFYIEQKGLFLDEGVARGIVRELRVFKDEHEWFALNEERDILLSELDVILMRKDPPFDLEYIYATYILEIAEKAGVFVVNKPEALRNANEKFFTMCFPDCCPPSLITRSASLLEAFHQAHQDIVCKPLAMMGGASVFRIKPGDVNKKVIFDTLTQNEQQYIIAQKFIPEIALGDKRILMINGEPVAFALARVPAPHDWRGNLAAGAHGVAQLLSERDKWICDRVGPVLREKGLYFVGLDVIGDCLTEINVTSPTCVRELDEQCELNISATLFDFIETKIK